MGARKSGIIKRKSFFTTGGSDGIVRFQKDTNECTTSVCVPLDAPFEVKVEEKSQKILSLIGCLKYMSFEKEPICQRCTQIPVSKRLENTSFPTKAFYILNDDLTMTLIWKDGELVE